MIEELKRQLEDVDEALTKAGFPIPYDGKCGPCFEDRIAWLGYQRDTFRRQRDEARKHNES